MKVAKREDTSVSFLKLFGLHLKKIRLEKNLSLEELGLEIGLTRMQIHRIERGYNITMITLLKLSLALKLSVSELINFEYTVKKDDLDYLVNTNKATKIEDNKLKKKKGKNT